MMRMIPSLLLAFHCLIVLGGDEWPQFRGPEGNGHSAARDLPLQWSESKNVVWKTAIHDRGWSSPVIHDNQLWLTTATQDGRQLFALCLDRDTGRILRDLKLFDVPKPSTPIPSIPTPRRLPS